MTENLITLTIEKLAGLGDGAGMHEGRRIFVPRTLAGDRVTARIIRKTKDADYAELVEVVKPSPDRITPVCRHYNECGGCTLQHVRDDIYNDFKQQMAREAVRKAGFDPGAVMPLARMKTDSRRRVDLKIENGRLGYFAERSHRLIDICECKVLESELEALILRIKPALTGVSGPQGLQINGVDGGYDLLFEGTGPFLKLKDDAIIRVGMRQDDKIKILDQKTLVTVTFGGVKVEAPPGAFLQASAEAQALMTSFVKESVGDAGRVLDLFCGLGTFSFPLAENAQVTAIEGDLPMVKAMQHAARKYDVKGFTSEVRNLFTRFLTPEKLKGYDAAVINPPRAGAKEQSLALASGVVKKLVMISCNPATFARDARALKEGGARLVRALPIDQFIFSSHLEILAEFAF